MGALQLSTGVFIPNHDMRRKSSGGRVGPPDGWTPTASLNSEIGSGVVKMRWEPLWDPGAGDYEIPAYPYGSGRCMTMEVAANSTSGVEREIWSPKSPLGSFFGAEQMNRDSTGYWYYRLRVMIMGRVLSAGGTQNGFTLGIDVWSNNWARHRRMCDINIGEADLDGTWKSRVSSVVGAGGVCDDTGWTAGPGGTIPEFATVFLGCAGGTNTRRVVLAVADVTLETLGPIDQGTGQHTLHAPTAPNTYYELSKLPLWQGIQTFRRNSLARQDVLPSGAMRTYDASGGVAPLSFEFPHDFLTRTDFHKLTRLWRANRGYPSNPDTYFGRPLPLVLVPNQPEFVWSQGFAKHRQGFYVDFQGDEFPLEPTGTWQRNDEVGQLYRGSLRFRER